MRTQTPSIGAQTQAYMAGPAAAMPVEVMGAFVAEHVNLDDAGVPTGVSAPGALMPDGELLDVSGAATSLAQVRAGRCSIGARGARSATSRYAPTRPNWRPPLPIGVSS